MISAAWAAGAPVGADTNNAAERGARDFALIRSLIATAKKQGWNVIHTLTQTPQALLENLRTA